LSEFYTYVNQWGNNILYRGIKNGRDVILKTPFSPSLFTKSKSKDTEWKSIYGHPMDEIVFPDIRDAKEFCKKYDSVSGFEIHGMQNFQYQYIANKFPGEVKYSLTDMNIVTIDIETRVTDSQGRQSFPDIQKADNEILLITLFDKHTKKATTFGAQPWDKSKCCLEAKDILKDIVVDYRCYDSEYAMMSAFIDFWSSNYPHIVTGWNSETFDFPYVCNRIAKIFGEDKVKQLSPFGIVNEKKMEIFGKDVQMFDIVGIIDADLLVCVKKYTYGNRESYSLEYVSTEELGVGKLPHHGTFREQYENHWADFVAYNIIDCLRVDQLDEKMQLISLLMEITYTIKCNAKDTFGTVKPWDIFIYNHLNGKKVCVPPGRHSKKEPFIGGWVKPPQLGMHGWTVSVDFSSLYPTIICQWNISPEVYTRFKETFTIDEFIDTIDSDQEYVSEYAAFNNLTVCANGTTYSKERLGFLPEIILGLLATRKVAKNKMLQHQQDKESGNYTDLATIEALIASLNNKQMAVKILNNSLFGAIGNVAFRYYELLMAEAITSTGQASDRHLERAINKFLNKILKTTDFDYVIAGDTDSLYINVDAVVKQHCPHKDVESITKWLDEFCEGVIQPVINKSVTSIFKKCNAHTKLMGAKREAIASKALWQAAKRYGMVVHNSEGVDYKPYKIKVQGLDMVKSSTPKIVRDDLKECLTKMFIEGEQGMQDHVQKVKESFYNTEPELIAFPRGVSDLDKYVDGQTYKSGCPIHVRAAIMYNNNRTSEEQTPIRNGDKIKFLMLKLPNPIKENVIGFPADGQLPNRDVLLKYVDYDTMWEKTFVAPLTGLTDVCGWNVEEVFTLDC
jgi:DNA polymerase elongation subunit (family B)